MFKLLNKPVTIGLFLKFMICLNIVFLLICWRFAYIGDIKDEEQQIYYNYLENRIDIQTKLIDRQNELINMYKNN